MAHLVFRMKVMNISAPTQDFVNRLFKYNEAKFTRAMLSCLSCMVDFLGPENFDHIRDISEVVEDKINDQIHSSFHC